LDGHRCAGECSTHYDDIPILLGGVDFGSHVTHPVVGVGGYSTLVRIVLPWVLRGKRF
jgi:hypothetical protein